MKARRARRVSVRRYGHSATSKFVVAWGTGSRPTAVDVALWDAQHQNAAPADRARYVRGNWKRHRSFFRTQEEADTFALAKEAELANGDARALALPIGLRVMAERCAKKLDPYGYTIEQAVDHFIDYLQTTRRSVTVSALKTEYVGAKRRKGNKERSLKDVDHRLKVFGQTFGERIVATITTAEVDDWLVSLGLSAQSQNNYRAVVRALIGFDLRAALPHVSVPTLVLAGGKDPNAPAAMMQKMAAQIPGARYHEIEGCGHLANIEQPQAFDSALGAFLDTLPVAADAAA